MKDVYKSNEKMLLKSLQVKCKRTRQSWTCSVFVLPF